VSERFKPFRREELDDRQRAVFDAIGSGPRGSVPWIFHLYLESPDLAARVQELGAFCRYRTGLPPHLSELAILVVARHWSAEYEWSVHESEARKAGLSDAVILAIDKEQTPSFDGDDAALVYAFCAEYLKENEVSDGLFARAVGRFGRKTVVELAGIVGYYSMLAMAIRIFRLPPQQ
jgi:4-carboxymuconolactone decarboxylase